MSVLLFSSLFCFIALFANVSFAAYKSPYFLTSKFDIVVNVWRNGGNNTLEQAQFVSIDINTVVDDFEYFKARAGVKLNYIPNDCTSFSGFRPKLPFRLYNRGLSPEREPEPRCGYTTWTSRMAVFTENGKQLVNLYDVVGGQHLFVVPAGDHFVWPGMYIGRQIVLEDVMVNGKPLVMETLSLNPRIFFIPNFITEEESSILTQSAQQNMIESLGLVNGKQQKITERSSKQSWLTCPKLKERTSRKIFGTEEEVVCGIDERVALTTRLSTSHLDNHSESLQVIHYSPMQHYHAHMDWFDPTLHPTEKGPRAGYNRLLTLLFYLNDVEEGGETIFPRAGPTGYGTEPNVDYATCSRGLKIKPQKGAGLLWYSLLPQGNNHEAFPDLMSLHGACDVLRGEKWAANKWIHNKMFPDDTDVVPEPAAPFVDESGSEVMRAKYLASRVPTALKDSKETQQATEADESAKEYDLLNLVSLRDSLNKQIEAISHARKAEGGGGAKKEDL